jgi:hypothetical protein
MYIYIHFLNAPYIHVEGAVCVDACCICIRILLAYVYINMHSSVYMHLYSGVMTNYPAVLWTRDDGTCGAYMQMYACFRVCVCVCVCVGVMTYYPAILWPRDPVPTSLPSTSLLPSPTPPPTRAGGTCGRRYDPRIRPWYRVCGCVCVSVCARTLAWVYVCVCDQA